MKIIRNSILGVCFTFFFVSPTYGDLWHENVMSFYEESARSILEAARREGVRAIALLPEVNRSNYHCACPCNKGLAVAIEKSSTNYGNFAIFLWSGEISPFGGWVGTFFLSGEDVPFPMEGTVSPKGEWVRLERREDNTYEFIPVKASPSHTYVARLIIEDGLAFPDGYAQVLAGDMNCDAGNPAIMRFLDAGWRETFAEIHGQEDPGFTFHGFLGPKQVSDLGKIDFVLARGPLCILDAQIIREHGLKKNGSPRYPSDHYFVSATFAL